MNSMRKISYFLMAMMMMAFALPSGAATPEKIFSISGIPASASAGSATITVTFKNETPTGNSNINSLRLIAPTGWTLSNPIAIAGGTVQGGTGSVEGGGASVSFVNLPGIKTGGKTWMMEVTVAVPASASCSNLWSAQAFNGNSLNGDIFRLVNSPSSLTTNVVVATGQATGFTTQPTNSVVGQVIPVAVALTTACGAGPAGALVTLTAPGCTVVSGCLSGNTATTDNNGVATFTALTINTFGTYQLTANTNASGFPTAISQSFTVYEGILNCGDPFASNFVNPGNLASDQPGYAAGSRGKYNKDGVSLACIPVPYTFTNNILSAPFDQVHLFWDVGLQPNAAFIYTMNWRLRNVDNANPLAGWTTAPRPDVAWLTDGSGLPIFVPGLACLSGKLPAPYGTLSAAINASVTSITITGVAAIPVTGGPAVPATPFPIVIPNQVNPIKTERMTATLLTSQSGTGPYTLTYDVTRGGAAEGFSVPTSHAAGAMVNSTPLPIIPNDATSFPPPYTAQTQANMCIAEHGWNSFAIGASGNTQLLYFTTVIDIGDGWVGIH